MKKTLSILFLLSLPMLSLAAATPAGPYQGEVDILKVLNTIINWVFAIFLAIAVLFIILAAFQFLTAGGNSEKVSEARDKLLYAAIGIAVAMLSKAIVPIVAGILNLQ